MVNPSINTVNNITKKDGKCLILHKQRIIPGNVLLNAPNNSGSPRLRRAATEKLNPTEPNAEDAVELPALTSRIPFEYNLGEFFGWAVRGGCVVCKNRGLAVRVGEVVLEDEGRARLGVGELDWFGDFKKESWWSGIEGCAVVGEKLWSEEAVPAEVGVGEERLEE